MNLLSKFNNSRKKFIVLVINSGFANAPGSCAFSSPKTHSGSESKKILEANTSRTLSKRSAMKPTVLEHFSRASRIFYMTGLLYVTGKLLYSEQLHNIKDSCVVILLLVFWSEKGFYENSQSRHSPAASSCVLSPNILKSSFYLYYAGTKTSPFLS